MTAYRSPWRHGGFVGAVAGLRWLLRPWPRAEARLISRLIGAENQRVERYIARHGVRSVLLILPRCVKPRGCGCDVRRSLGACRACADCQLGPVARLCEELGVSALVAFRSHHAFAIARSERPDLIVASACPDRLVKALRTVPEIPALLHPLTGMERLCIGARFDSDWLARTLRGVTPVRAPRVRAEKVG